MRAPAVLAALGLLVVALVSRAARAEGDAGVCSAERQEVAALRRSIEACSAGRREATARVARCEVERDEAARRGADLTASLEGCRDDGARICGAAGALAGALASENKPAELPPVPGCVSPALQVALGQMVEGRATAASLLSDLAAYLGGATDVPPQPRAANGTVLRQLVDRLVGGGRGAPPLVVRRLLVESIERVAPRFWRRTVLAGRDAVERWLSSAAPLDDAFVSEAHGASIRRDDAGGAASPSLVSALRLVQTYRELAGCERRAGAPRECARARQLQSLLENSGPLVVRQRVHEIWSTTCAQVAEGSVLGWVRDLPLGRADFGKGEWHEIAAAARAKLFSCYLADGEALGPGAGAGPRDFAAWLGDHLPPPAGLTARALERIDDLRAAPPAAADEAACTRAVDALARLERAPACSLPPRSAEALLRWFSARGPADRDLGSLELRACARAAEALWGGRVVEIAEAPGRVPAVEDLVTIKVGAAGGAAELRAACEKRLGSSRAFPDDLRAIARIAAATGEDVAKGPWLADATTLAPLEAGRLRDALTFSGWLRGALGRMSACGAMGLDDLRCRTCAGALRAAAFDCQAVAELRARWSARTERGAALTGGALALVALLLWARALRRASRWFGPWRAQVRAHLAGIGLPPGRDWLRWLLPSRFAALTLELPRGADWQRWGRVARVVKASAPGQIGARDIAHAAGVARAAGAELALLLHDEGASPDLPAVRALLEWAAKGPRGGVQILPIATERLRWTRTADDLLDIVEQTSLRGNPFDVRGRLASSSQFFNRERLVSGLLAAAQAGQWVVITGLRRFGKSSLALEVARRLPGPSAYVDLAGFHHEFSSASDPSAATAALLRYMLLQLRESARARYRAGAALPEPPDGADGLDAGALLVWLRRFVSACSAADGDRTPSFLVIFDEVEQAIGVGPAGISHALDVLSTLIGRLRACLLESLGASGCRFGVVFCGAVHPLLWAPLSTLGKQSLVGAFQSVFVPRLPDDAAYGMMRGLGARQGIRFTDAALEVVVRETAAIPLLARRVGSSVLELYDPERARHGGLGAVEVGVEGARAAVQREEEPGSPLRVWVESEIGDPQNPAGAILRRVAASGRAPTDELRRLGARMTAAQLGASGIAALIGPAELERRSLEATGFILRMLIEIGLLAPEGDPAAPEAVVFPDSIVRRILASDLGPTGFGF